MSDSSLITMNLENEIDKLQSFIDINSTMLTGNENLRFPLLYTCTCLSFAQGVKCLFVKELYDSLYPLARSFFEAYALNKVLSANFYRDDYTDLIRFLIVLDMHDDLSTSKKMRKDKSIGNSIQNEADIATYYSRFRNLINEFFPESSETMQTNKEIKDFVSSKKEFYEHKFSKYSTIGDRVNFALCNNGSYKSIYGEGYDGADVVYRILCAESHSQIGAIDSRLINNNILSVNQWSKNIEPLMGLVIICINDLLIDLKSLTS